ncbi:hypothetical protein FE783_15425 [Paenibacillus mesophilus]|nr:hypothetical protein FE783_15425 [Paenibacillus mesophilus]
MVVHRLVQIYHRFKYWEFVFMIPIVLLSLYVRLRYFFYLRSSGKFPQSPDSDWYIQYAHNLMANFKIGSDMNDIMYIGYNLLLTVLLAIVKDPVNVLFIQAVTAGLAVILVFKIGRMLFNLRTALIAAFFYSYSWDITLWTTYILTDSFFISLLLLSVYLLLKCYESDKKRYKILFALSALYMLVFRPAGILTLGFMLLYIVFNLDRRRVTAFLKKHRLAIGGVLTAAVVAIVWIYAGGKLDSLVASLQFNAKKVLYNQYANGWIYDLPSPQDHKFRPDYTINVLNSLILSFIINNWDHIMILYGKRSIAFLGRWVWTTDVTTIAGLKKLAWHLLPSALFLIATVAAIVNKLFRKASIVWLLIFSVFLFCIIFFIDGMFRYKAPSIPFFAIAAAYGADRAIYGAIWIIKKVTGKLPWNKGKYSL